MATPYCSSTSPIRENSEFSMNWEITKEVYDEFIKNQSTNEG